MRRRVWLVDAALVLLLVAAIYALSRQDVTGGALPDIEPLEDVDLSSGRVPEAAQPTVDEGLARGAVDRDLFEEDRTHVEAPEPDPEPADDDEARPEDAERPNIRLTSIFAWHEGLVQAHVVGVEGSLANEKMALRLGETIYENTHPLSKELDGWTVQDIDGDGIVLAKAGVTEAFDLNQDKPVSQITNRVYTARPTRPPMEGPPPKKPDGAKPDSSADAGGGSDGERSGPGRPVAADGAETASSTTPGKSSPNVLTEDNPFIKAIRAAQERKQNGTAPPPRVNADGKSAAEVFKELIEKMRRKREAAEGR